MKFEELTLTDINNIKADYENGIRIEHMARKYDVSPQTMLVWVKRFGFWGRQRATKYPRITEDEIKQVIKMNAEGMSRRQIQKELGVTLHAISKCLDVTKNEHSEEPNFRLNPNPPTQLTKDLICKYYVKDIQQGLSHEEAIKDIHIELSRSYDYILEILRGEGLAS